MGGKLWLHSACAYLCLNACDLYGAWLYLGGHARINEPAGQPANQPASQPQMGFGSARKKLAGFLRERA